MLPEIVCVQNIFPIFAVASAAAGASEVSGNVTQGIQGILRGGCKNKTKSGSTIRGLLTFSENFEIRWKSQISAKFLN